MEKEQTKLGTRVYFILTNEDKSLPADPSSTDFAAVEENDVVPRSFLLKKKLTNTFQQILYKDTTLNIVFLLFTTHVNSE